MKVTPWEVEGEIDYLKLIKQFGTSYINNELLDKIKQKAGELHVLLKRRFFFSHRDLDKVLNDVEQGKGFFIYTGRGPSGKMHIGHLPPFLLAQWMQKVFNVNVYIQISDDEKFLVKRKLSFDEINAFSYDNILDIIALGFDPNKTFIFRNTEFIKHMYSLAIKLARKVTFSTVKAVFGLSNESNVGIIFYPILQTIPTFFERKRALIPCGIDQDPYWRIQRDHAESLGYYKAAAIHTKFLSPLQGVSGKMSSSKANTAIWLDDDEATIKNKIMRYAFSGGRPTIEEHRKYGGNPDIDVSFNWLYFIFEEDDKRIKKIYDDYKSGALLTGELKAILIEKLIKFIKDHKRKKKDAEKKINAFMYDGKLAKSMWEKFM